MKIRKIHYQVTEVQQQKNYCCYDSENAFYQSSLDQ